MSGRSGRYLAGVAAVVVIGVVAAGLSIVGSPAAARRQRSDQARVEHLRQISAAINLHWTRNRALPTALDQLADQTSISRADPAGVPYGYRTIDERTYELCAEFQDPSPPSAGNTFWRHQAGRQCFRVAVEKVQP